MRLFQHPNGIWYAELSRTLRRSLKTRDRAEAQRLYRLLKREALAGRVRYLEGKPPAKKLGDFFAEYLDHSGSMKSRFTHQTDGVAFRQFLRVFPADTDLSRIDRRSIERWLSSLPVRPTSANTWLRHLKAAFNKAQSWGYLAGNPFSGIKPLRTHETQDRYLSPQDVERIVRAEENTSWRLLWLFMVHTGVRRSEALQVMAPIDYDSRRLKVQGKGGKWRLVIITPEVEVILRAHPVQVGLLWPWQPDTVSHHFQATAKRAGVKARLHDLRHTYASNLARAGVDMRVVQRLLGHADIKTTQRYEHLSLDWLEQVLAAKTRQGGGEAG